MSNLASGAQKVANINSFHKQPLISSKNRNAQHATMKKKDCPWEGKFRTENGFL